MAEGNGAGNETNALPENWSDNPEVKALVTQSIQDAVGRETQGLVSKRDELLDEVKKFKGIAKSFEGLGDIEEAKAALQKVRDLEEEQLKAANKFDELFEKKTERMKEDHGVQVKKLADNVEGLQTELSVYKSKLGEVTIEGGIRDAALEIESKVYDKAWPDLMARGKAIFKLNEKGESEPRDANGNIIYGKDATTPITFKEWMESLVESAPHFFDARNRGGAGVLANTDTGRKGKTLDDQLAEAIKNKDLQLQIRLKRLIANTRA